MTTLQSILFLSDSALSLGSFAFSYDLDSFGGHKNRSNTTCPSQPGATESEAGGREQSAARRCAKLTVIDAMAMHRTRVTSSSARSRVVRQWGSTATRAQLEGWRQDVGEEIASKMD